MFCMRVFDSYLEAYVVLYHSSGGSWFSGLLILYMKYLNAIKPFEIISAIADMSILRKKDQPAQQGSSKKEEAGVKSV